MNKKHLIYSFQYAAVLASVLTFSSCKKDEFTAEQALDIENKRKQFQFDLDEKSKDNEATRANFMMWQARKIDSLQKVNAGGQVFYSVTVVPGGSSAFGQGRFEEVGVNDVTVTVEQYGFTQTATTKNGIAFFAKPLFSGEANVTVDAAPKGYTSVSYLANLTPDGGVPNDGTVFVGNIIPVFENDFTKADAADKVAMISGQAWADLDLTNGTGADNTGNTNPPNEENAPEGTAFSAVINVDSDAFRTRYLREWGEEGGIHIGGSGNTPGTGVATKSGFIQRIAYESASQVARVQGDGSYTMMVAATASGLPMKMRYSDFAYDRKFITDGGREVNERCLYGPEVVYDDDLLYGEYGFLYDFDVNLVQTDATVTATLTKGTSPYYSAETSGNLLRPVGGIGSNGTENRYRDAGTLVGGVDVGVTTSNNAGAYLHAPTVSFSAPTLAGGVQTVGTTVMYPSKAFGAVSFGSNAFYNSAAGTTGIQGENLNLRGIKSIKLSTIGSGYATPPTVTLKPNFPGGEGTGSLQASSSGISYIRVIDGGYGLVFNSASHDVNPSSYGSVYPAAPTNAYDAHYTTADLSTLTKTYQVVGQFTGVLPLVEIDGGTTPTGGALASAYVVVNTTIGTLDEIVVDASGSGYSPSDSDITFNTGKNAQIEYTDAAGTLASSTSFVAVANGAGFTVKFNTTAGPNTDVAADGEATAAIPEFADAGISFPGGANYTFVPTVQVLQAPGDFVRLISSAGVDNDNATVAGISVLASVRGDDGKVVSLSIVGTPSIGGTFAPALAPGDEFRARFDIKPRTLPATAEAYLTGSGIDNYVVTELGSNYGSVDAVINDGSGAFNSSAVATDYDYYTNAGAFGGPGTAGLITSLPNASANAGDYEVEFYGATGLAGNTVTNPTAVPVFQSGGSTLSGIRIFSPGVNIAPGTGTGTTAVPAIKWRIIPRGYKAATITAQLAPAAITFTITDGGLGYAVRPDMILTTDKLTYIQTAALNNIANFKYDINAAGVITKIEFSPLAAGASAVLAMLNDATVAGTLQTPIITVAPQESWLYSESSLAVNVDRAIAGTGNLSGTDGFYYFLPSGSTIVANGDANGRSDAAAWLAYGNNANAAAGGAAIMHWPQATAVFGEPAGSESVAAYYTGFTLDVSNYATLTFNGGLAGTNGAPGSGASASVNLNPANGQVALVELTSAGSGYLANIDLNVEPITKNFTVFGGPDGYKTGAFETYSGIQYVRDIHYGIGKRIH